MDLSSLRYNRRTGELLNTKKPNNRGWVDFNGYHKTCFQGRVHYTHRLIWFLTHGEWPRQIDHINGNRSDNRLKNLREVSQRENCLNKIKNRKGKLPGVTFCRDTRRTKPWKATLQVGRTHTFLGYYATETSAHQAYTKAVKQRGLNG